MLSDTKRLDPVSQDLIAKIYDKCEICLKSSLSKLRPKVSPPISSYFNEVVAMDLKIWPKRNTLILYLIDTFTCFTQAYIIPDKKPETINNRIMNG